MKGGLGSMMKQVQKMQEDMQKVQEELASEKVVGEAGGGMVRVTMNGRHEAVSVEIDDALVGEDKEMLEDLVAAAINDAVHRVEKNSQEKLAGVTSGLGLPPGFKLPF